MTSPVIQASNVGKRYTKYLDAPLLVSRLVRLRASRGRETLWAVKGVSLDVLPGEVLGIVGQNGSGKTTLLRMMAGVTAPSEGTMHVRGLVAPLISVGVGFHPELTGRENIYVNGSILGLTRREIDSRFDEIVDFAEIRDFIDTPVKFYSSGMFVRLGFSVAVTAEPNVLVVDEVLAVGDLSFQIKSFERMQQLCSGGAAVVIVSHNLNAIRRMCDRTAVLHEGRLVFDGGTAEALGVYHELLGERDEPDGPARPGELRRETRADIVSLELVDSDGSTRPYLESGGRARLRATVAFLEDVDDPCIGFEIFSADGVRVFAHSTFGQPTGSFGAGERARWNVEFDASLTSQSYTAFFGVRDNLAQVELARAASVTFYSHGADGADGVADLHASYELVSPPPADPTAT